MADASASSSFTSTLAMESYIGARPHHHARLSREQAPDRARDLLRDFPLRGGKRSHARRQLLRQLPRACLGVELLRLLHVASPAGLGGLHHHSEGEGTARGGLEVSSSLSRDPRDLAGSRGLGAARAFGRLLAGHNLGDAQVSVGLQVHSSRSLLFAHGLLLRTGYTDGAAGLHVELHKVPPAGALLALEIFERLGPIAADEDDALLPCSHAQVREEGQLLGQDDALDERRDVLVTLSED
eukprot:757895-Hanusia_phi.AAC.4